MGFSHQLFFEEIRGMATAGFSACRCAEDIARVVGRVAEAAEALLAVTLDPVEAEHIACRAGCGTCCRLNVPVLFPEAIAIAGFLRRSLDDVALGGLVRRVKELDEATRWLDDEERIMVNRPCVFLDEAGCCVIHPVRPLLCRSVTSSDAEACRLALLPPLAWEPPAVLMNRVQKSLMEAAYKGMGAALEDLQLDSRGWRVTGAMALLLTDPASVDAFLAGERSEVG